MLPCGRGSGKTTNCRREVVLNCLKPEPQGRTSLYLCSAPTQDHANELWWDHLLGLIPPDWVKEARLSKHRIIVVAPGGVESHIYVAGLDRPKRVEGKQYRAVWIDETSDIKPGAVERSILPALSDFQGRLSLLGVPKRYAQNGPDYKVWCEKGFDENEPDYQTFHWSSADIISPAELEIARKALSAEDFQEQYGGEWLAVGGACFYNYKKEEHVKPVQYDPTRPILVGCDFNVSPMSWVLTQTDGRQCFVFDEISIKNTNTKATLDLLYGKYGLHKGGWRWFGDPAGNARHTSASASDWATILNDQRFKGQPCVGEKAPPVRDRLASCNALLRNAAGQSRCTIDPRCQMLIQDLDTRGIDSTGLPNDRPGGMIGHMSDAWGYLVHALWPSTVVGTPGAPQFHDSKMW